MESSEITGYIIERLSRGVKADDLIFDVCQKTNTTWSEAEDLINRIQSDNSSLIVRKQFPLQFMIALAVFICGLGLLAFGIYSIASQLALVNAFISGAVQGNPQIDAIQKLSVTFMAIYRLGITPLAALTFGLAMILGSLIGMRDVWEEILFSH